MEPADAEFCTALHLIVQARSLRLRGLVERRPRLEHEADELVERAVQLMTERGERAAVEKAAARPRALGWEG